MRCMDSIEIELLTTAAAADRLGVSPTTISRMIADGDLVAQRPGGPRRAALILAPVVEQYRRCTARRCRCTP